MQVILFVDDDKVRVDAFFEGIKNDPNFRLFWTNSVLQAQIALDSFKGSIPLIMLDHDLGDGTDVIELARWMVENKVQQESTIVVHSMNPVGNQRIFDYLDSAGYEVYSLPGSWGDFVADGQGQISYSGA